MNQTEAFFLHAPLNNKSGIRADIEAAQKILSEISNCLDSDFGEALKDRCKELEQISGALFTKAISANQKQKKLVMDFLNKRGIKGKASQKRSKGGSK